MESTAFIDIAREFLEKVTFQLDPHTSQKGEIVVSEDKVILLTPIHIQFAVYGRGPGKRPPLDPILDWVKKTGVIFSGTDARGTAFAIQASISKNGTKKWVRNAPNALEQAIKLNFDLLQKQFSDAVAVEIHGQLQQAYTKIKPKANYTI